MVCTLDLGTGTEPYPAGFPTAINLDALEIFTQKRFIDLMNEAAANSCSHYCFALVKDKNNVYAIYDAINWRVHARYNQETKTITNPVTRSVIESVHYFAIELLPNNQPGLYVASCYPPASYFNSDLVVKKITRERIIRFAFAAINYNVTPDGDSNNYRLLQKIRLGLNGLLDLSNESSK